MSDDYIDWEKAARKYNIEIGEKDATIARLTKELEEARRWVNDLQSGMYINCVYCGHRYGPKNKVPCTMADALKQHIEQCPKHPMSKLKAENAALLTRLRDYEKVVGLLINDQNVWFVHDAVLMEHNIDIAKMKEGK